MDTGQQMLSSGRKVCGSKRTWLDNTHHLPVLLSIKSPFQRTFPQYSSINLCLGQYPSDVFTSHRPCILHAFLLVTRPHYGPSSQHMIFRGTYSHQMCPSQASGFLWDRVITFTAISSFLCLCYVRAQLRETLPSSWTGETTWCWNSFLLM